MLDYPLFIEELSIRIIHLSNNQIRLCLFIEKCWRSQEGVRFIIIHQHVSKEDVIGEVALEGCVQNKGLRHQKGLSMASKENPAKDSAPVEEAPQDIRDFFFLFFITSSLPCLHHHLIANECPYPHLFLFSSINLLQIPLSRPNLHPIRHYSEGAISLPTHRLSRLLSSRMFRIQKGTKLRHESSFYSIIYSINQIFFLEKYSYAGNDFVNLASVAEKKRGEFNSEISELTNFSWDFRGKMSGFNKVWKIDRLQFCIANFCTHFMKLNL
ncbi:hypothetical protein M9H77_26945 [Catharanthus roseus]|uniref:Uncharacterized protein n=1 Tax=Catharanthus roseus TaxID=4058 RepID=A0ACC0AB48_CATRO|nr:hypothetical protein M9H77_26945 [Catharanthus roseus]